MRIVLIVPDFPRLSETFVVHLFLGLLGRGLDVHVVCRRSADIGWAAFPELAGRPDLLERVHVSPRSGSRVKKALRLLRSGTRCVGRSPAGTVRFLLRARRCSRTGVLAVFQREAKLVALAPDVVHFQFGADAVGRESLSDLLDCASVVSFQGYDIEYAGIEQDPGFYSELWHRTDAVHFVTEALKVRAERRGLPPTASAHVILNAIDPGFFDPGGRVHDEVAGTVGRPLRILSVGRLHWTKGYEYALSAVRRLTDAGVHCEHRIIGEGDLRASLLFTTEDLGLDGVVTLLGAQDRPAVREQMGWADVLLHAAVSESFCLVAAEAQAMRLPVVVTDAGGLPENVADGRTGFVVPRRDPEALSERLADLTDPELRQRMGQAGFERARSRFDPGSRTEAMEALYREAIAVKSRKTDRTSADVGSPTRKD